MPDHVGHDNCLSRVGYANCLSFPATTGNPGGYTLTTVWATQWPFWDATRTAV
jgi:hypothetical protein